MHPGEAPFLAVDFQESKMTDRAGEYTRYINSGRDRGEQVGHADFCPPLFRGSCLDSPSAIARTLFAEEHGKLGSYMSRLYPNITYI